MWKLIIADDQGQHTTVSLVRDEYRIGRADDNPIRLTERNVSRHHALVRRTQTGFSIEDSGSYGGTLLNGVRVQKAQPLGHRDLVQLGDYRIEVIDETLDTQEQGHGPLPGVGPTTPPARLPHRLVVLIGPGQGTEYPLEGDRLLIGRDDDCDIRIDHGSVSRIHAEVRRLDEDLFEVIDKGSANGLRINGHDRPKALLDGRDVVELGDVVLKYIPRGQVFRVDAAEGERIAALSGGSVIPPASEARLPLGAPLLAAIAGAIVIGGILVFALRGAGREQEVESKPAQNAALATAIALHASGDVLRAHEEVVRVARFGHLQESSDLEAIESDWAKAILRAAQAERGLERKRELLLEVAQARTVPARHRQTALTALEKLPEAKDAPTGEAEDVTSLPEDKPDAP